MGHSAIKGTLRSVDQCSDWVQYLCCSVNCSCFIVSCCGFTGLRRCLRVQALLSVACHPIGLNRCFANWIDDPNKNLLISSVCLGVDQHESSRGYPCTRLSDWKTHHLNMKYGCQKFSIKLSSRPLSVLARSAWLQVKHIEFSIHNLKMFNVSSRCLIAKQCSIYEMNFFSDF